MPRDASGVYTLPDGYQAVSGNVIQPSQHNPPLEDIATALTGSLPRAGSAAMLGALKLFDGTEDLPGLSFASAPATGFFKTGSGIGVSVGGEQVAEFSSAGSIGLPIGTWIPILDEVLPPLCVWADGRNISRASYPKLFTKWGTRYGTGDGSTTFGVYDLRGRVVGGRDNFGGTDSSRWLNVPVISGTRLTVGAILGGNLVTLTIAQMPGHTHPGSVTGTDGSHQHGYLQNPNSTSFGTGPTPAASSQAAGQTDLGGAHFHGVSVASQGGNAAHNNVQQTFICDFAIYAGD
jgi:microcystin-dependent protein